MSKCSVHKIRIAQDKEISPRLSSIARLEYISNIILLVLKKIICLIFSYDKSY